VAGARGEVLALRAALAELPTHGDPAWLRRVLVDGFADKVRRWEALPAARLARAELKDVTPRVDLRVLARRVTDRLVVRARVAFAFLLAWLAPGSALAQEWWPEDTGALELDTGAADPIAAAVDTGSSGSPDDGSFGCDIVAANCGWLDLEGCFQACCGDVCSDTCDLNCGDSCDCS
jgi:hypothetical protein